MHAYMSISGLSLIDLFIPFVFIFVSQGTYNIDFTFVYEMTGGRTK